MTIRYLRLPEVLERRGVSQATHYRDIQRGVFPKGVPLGRRAVGWIEAEVDFILRAQACGYTEEELQELVEQLLEERKDDIAIAGDRHQPRHKKTLDEGAMLNGAAAGFALGEAVR